MSLDPFVHPDDAIQALLQVSGVSAWKLWGPNAAWGDVHLTLRSATRTYRTSIPWQASEADWLERIASLLDAVRQEKT